MVEAEGKAGALTGYLQRADLIGAQERPGPIDDPQVCRNSYQPSLRHIEEMMAERGVFVDHATVHRWSIKILPVLAAVFRRHKRPVGTSWRMDETYIKVGSQWKYLYRAVDRAGATIDFMLRAHRDLAAARRFLE